MTISTVRKFGVGIASAAMVLGLAGPAMAAGGEANLLPNGTSVMRLSGETRVMTSLAVAKERMKEAGVTKAYVVGYDAIADAASAGSLNDGVLIVAPSDKSGQLLLGKYLSDDDVLKGITELVAIGGKAVVPDSALENIKTFDSAIVKTSRIDGKNRYETSAAIAAKSTAPTKVFLTRGDVLVDALAAGALRGGPILLVNPTGAVDPAVVKYYQNSGVSQDNVLVLGGDSALSDAQVQKVVGDHKTISPWKYAATEAELRKSVQKAAALYFGNAAWQKQAKGLQPNPANGAVAYFGFGSSAPSITDPSVVDPRLVKTEELQAGDGDKAFVGYMPTYEKLKVNATGINGKYSTLKATFDQELNNAVAAKQSTTAAAMGTNTALAAAFKALYGMPVVDATTTGTVGTDFKVTNADKATFTFNDKDQITGVNTALVAKINKAAKDAAGTADVAQIDSSPAVAVGDYKAGSLKAVVENADGFKAEDKSDANGQRINWAVLKDLVDARLKSQDALTKSAEASLKAAVAKYQAKPWDKVVTQAKGVKRIIGADRYSTSALISYYGTMMDGVPMGQVYMASGDDGHLIDSVVTGQLINGSIVLVPTSGALNDDTKAELSRLAKATPTLTAYAIGGDKAVSSDTIKAVASAMRW